MLGRSCKQSWQSILKFGVSSIGCGQNQSPLTGAPYLVQCAPTRPIAFRRKVHTPTGKIPAGSIRIRNPTEAAPRQYSKWLTRFVRHRRRLAKSIEFLAAVSSDYESARASLWWCTRVLPKTLLRVVLAAPAQAKCGRGRWNGRATDFRQSFARPLPVRHRAVPQRWVRQHRRCSVSLFPARGPTCVRCRMIIARLICVET